MNAQSDNGGASTPTTKAPGTITRLPKGAIAPRQTAKRKQARSVTVTTSARTGRKMSGTATRRPYTRRALSESTMRELVGFFKDKDPNRVVTVVDGREKVNMALSHIIGTQK